MNPKKRREVLKFIKQGRGRVNEGEIKQKFGNTILGEALSELLVSNQIARGTEGYYITPVGEFDLRESSLLGRNKSFIVSLIALVVSLYAVYLSHSLSQSTIDPQLTMSMDVSDEYFPIMSKSEFFNPSIGIVGARLNLCFRNRGQMDTGPLSIILFDPILESGYENMVVGGRDFNCTRINIKHKYCYPDDCPAENLSSDIQPGLRDLRFYVECTKCNEKRRRWPEILTVCIWENKSSECDRYIPQ